MRRSGSGSFRPGSMADVLGSSSTVQLRRSPSASNWNLFRSDDLPPEPPHSTEPHKTYRIAELQPVTNYGSFEDHSEKDEEKALPSEDPSGTKPEAGIPPESKTKRRVKVGILFCFFFSLIMLWLLAQQIDPEVAEHHLVAVDASNPVISTPTLLFVLYVMILCSFLVFFNSESAHTHDLIKGQPLDVLMLRVTGMKVLQPVLLYFQLLGPPSGAENSSRPVLGTWNVELLADEEVEESHYFDIDTSQYIYSYDSVISAFVTTNTTAPIALELEYQQLHWFVHYEVLVGVIILVSVYAMLVLELMHRTTTAMFGSFWAVSALSTLHARPSFAEITSWIDFNTLAMLFGMMVIVGMLTNTGFFEFAAARAYKLAKGKVWRLLLLLCVLILFISMFIDNVTTTLLFIPVTIRLCSVIDLNPLPFIVAEVLFVNMGGAATAIGDPPNILIVNTPSIKETGLVNFGNFAMHVAPGILMAAVAVFMLLKLLFKNSMRSMSDSTLEREIEMWKRTAERIPFGGTEEESVVRVKLSEYIKSLRSDLETSRGSEGRKEEDQTQAESMDIGQLEETYKITDMRLFIKTISVLGGVIGMFCLNSFAQLGLNIVWIALLGAVTLLIITDVKDMSAVLAKVEFGTLLFFAALFVMMKALDQMGVLAYFANLTADLIVQVPAGNLRLAVAITLVIWVGGTVGAFIDNIPFTQTMLPIVVRLTQGDLGLPLTPLVWALSFGCNLGGNATAIGASANVVAAGLAEQNGYRMTFMYFTKVGLPCTVVSLLVVNVYLLLTHVLIPWY